MWSAVCAEASSSSHAVVLCEYGYLPKKGELMNNTIILQLLKIQGIKTLVKVVQQAQPAKKYLSKDGYEMLLAELASVAQNTGQKPVLKTAVNKKGRSATEVERRRAKHKKKLARLEEKRARRAQKRAMQAQKSKERREKADADLEVHLSGGESTTLWKNPECWGRTLKTGLTGREPSHLSRRLLSQGWVDLKKKAFCLRRFYLNVWGINVSLKEAKKIVRVSEALYICEDVQGNAVQVY
jgi:hypothetical protein